MNFSVHNAKGFFEILGLTLLIIRSITALPAISNDYLPAESDSSSVGSLQREVRQLTPPGTASEVGDLVVAGNEFKQSLDKKNSNQNKPGLLKTKGFFETYDSQADGTKGYVTEEFGQGDRGYKNLDSFHKQNGDNYGYEKHTLYGSGKSGKKGSHPAKKQAHSTKQDDHEGSGTSVESYYADDSESQSDGLGGEYYSGGDDEYSGKSGEADSSSYSESENYNSSGEGGSEYSGEGGAYYGDY